MCGCGCELGLVLAACQAGEARLPATPKASAAPVPHPHSVLERLMLAWLACMFGDTPMQRLSRGSGR